MKHLYIKNTDIGFEKTLIADINLSAELGSVCLLIGNNGVGKTTLIKSVLNQISLLRGDILIQNKSVRELSVKEIAEEVAVVFSKSVIPQNHTVEDLISLGKYIHYPYYFGLNAKDRDEISEIIRDLDLEIFKTTLLKNLSDGNLQKAFIGRAIAQNSPLIILDEPTTHLDEKNKIIILKTLRKLAKEHNKLIVFSSHDWRLAKEFAVQIWYVKDHHLYSGLVEDVLLAHHELTDVSLFTVNKNFVSPQIYAPEVYKEMLFSLLQKNYDEDLSQYIFTFDNQVWKIEYRSLVSTCESFEEIIFLLKNIH